MDTPQMPSTNRLSLWLATCCLLLATSSATAETDIAHFSDEAETAKHWFAVNDTVMGGVSEGRVALNKDGYLEFTGDLSMKNNGGFASIRTRDTDGILDDNSTINIRLRGDGRMYYLSLRDKNRQMASSHRHPIMTEKGKWIDVSVGLDELEYARFGQSINRPELKTDEVIGIGFALSDKKPGPFKLEIASITASQTAAQTNESTDNTIVGIAQQAGSFKTLLAAAQAAGLVDALSDPDASLTVFAPTDDAFAALPKGTVETLLKKENRQELVALLLNHVVEGEVTLTRQVQTPAGETLTIRTQGSATVGNATVLQADIRASNGIVHAIDRVLLPKAMQPTPQGEAMRLINKAISKGVPAYNHGSPDKCADIYEAAVADLTSKYRTALGESTARMLDIQMQMAKNSQDHDANAWTLRAALDYAHDALSESMDEKQQKKMMRVGPDLDL